MADFDGFPAATTEFLRGVTEHNDKAWFDAHRDLYQAGYVEPAKAFVAAIGPRLQVLSPGVSFEPKVNGSLFRINRDVRFSKDKRPYKNHLDLWFWHGGRRGWGHPGFYFRLFADRLVLGAGMHRFEKEQLAAYRQAVVDERTGVALVSILDSVRESGLYKIGGVARKTVPRGFDRDHLRAALLLHDGLTAEYDGGVGKELHTGGFIDVCMRHFKAVRPVSAWLLETVAAEQPIE